MENRIFSFAALGAIMLPFPASAMQSGDATLAERFAVLEARVTTLDRENAELRRKVEELINEPSALPPVAGTLPSPPASANAQPALAVQQEPTDIWEGPYVGIGLGISETQFTYQAFDIRLPITEDERTPRGFSFGAQLGHRWQFGSIVTGIELEASFPQANSYAASRSFSDVPFRIARNLNMSARVKGQLGVALGPVLTYGTLGLQVSRIGYSMPAFNSLTPRIPRELTLSGLVYGAGVAARLTPQLSLELEAVESRFGTLPFTPTGEFRNLEIPTESGRNREIKVRLTQKLR